MEWVGVNRKNLKKENKNPLCIVNMSEYPMCHYKVKKEIQKFKTS